MKLTTRIESTELDLPNNLDAAIEHTVEAAFVLKISEAQLLELVKKRLHKKIDIESAHLFFLPTKLFHPEAGP